MNKILNELIQLQELEFALMEQRQLVDESRLADLEEAIAALMGDLPDNVAAVYRRLKAQGPPVIVAETDGRCSACGMSLPTAQVGAIIAAESLQRCQNCNRILYHLEAPPRQSRSDPREKRAQAGVARFSSVDLMMPRLEAENGRDAIVELAELMAERGFVENPDPLVAAALRREASAPTALGHGLAIPHVRGVEGGGLTFSLGLKPDGLKFDPSTNEPAQVVFFMVIPAAASSFYLRLLSGLIETFRDERARDKLLACEAPEAMWKVLNKLTAKTIN
jgi:mannitol/fructose-specific phosphotransferase system IIA component (Ntr-type)